MIDTYIMNMINVLDYQTIKIKIIHYSVRGICVYYER